MNRDKILAKNLNKIFKSEEFMISLMKDLSGFSDFSIYERMGEVLEYYISTRDERTDYTFEQIEKKLREIQNGSMDKETYKRNCIDDGFMTSSMNGNKRKLVEKYGLGYAEKMTEKEKRELLERRENLNQLEEKIHITPFCKGEKGRGETKKEEKEEKVEKTEAKKEYLYFCSPGGKTFHYACEKSPERLWKGPLYGYEQFPRIVGEKKETFARRVLKHNIEGKTGLEECTKKVAKDYCSERPCFALIKISKIKDVKVNLGYFDERFSTELQKRLDDLGNIDRFFCRSGTDQSEINNLDDLVCLPEAIPKDAVEIVECMDEFELRNIFAKAKGLKFGEKYNTHYSKNEIGVRDLIEVIKDCKTSKDLDELSESYEKRKEILEKRREELEDEIKENNSKEENAEICKDLKKKKEELETKKKEIYGRDYTKKDGIDENLRLEKIVEELKIKGFFNDILENDKLLKKDELQYGSDLHGVSHTRRVAFYSTLVAAKKMHYNIGKEVNHIIGLARTIANNHDIGRVNDAEDKEHGLYSVKKLEENPERLDGISEEEQDIIKFVIKEHSLSQKENEDDLQKIQEREAEKILEEYHKRYGELFDVMFEKEGKTAEEYAREKAMKRAENVVEKDYRNLLDICKDADKLDRVRLDPRGYYSREGLDPERLSLEGSKTFENVAYEGYDKLLEILDLENELKDINEELSKREELKFLQAEPEFYDSFNERLSEQREVIKQKGKEIRFSFRLDRIYSKVASIPEKIKQLLTKSKEKDDLLSEGNIAR